MLLKELVDIEKFNKLIESGWINTTYHPKDSKLCLCKYSRKTVYDANWSKETKISRGLLVYNPSGVIDNESYILERPFAKFFTLEQLGRGLDSEFSIVDDEEDGSSLKIQEKIDMNVEVNVYDKLDGCMLLMYESDCGVRVTTSGSFESEEAIFFDKLLKTRDDYKQLSDDILKIKEGKTFIFEGISKNLHIIKYDKVEIRYIGYTDINSGIFYAPCEDLVTTKIVNKYFNSVDFICKTKLSEAVNMLDRENKEGVVFSSSPSANQVIYKYKYKNYLTIRSLMYKIGRPNAATKHILDYIRRYGEPNGKYWEYYGISEKEYDVLDETYKRQLEEECDNVIKDFYSMIAFAKEVVDKERELNKNNENTKEVKRLIYEKYKDSGYVNIIQKMYNNSPYIIGVVNLLRKKYLENKG